MKVKFARGRRPLDVVQDVREAAIEMSEVVKRDYGEVTDNWEHAVDFDSDEIEEGDDLVINVAATGANEDIFRYVDEGTEKRYAVMNTTFSSRTSPGSLISGGGGNRRVAYFDYTELAAGRRFIEAREFGKEIVHIRENEYLSLMRRTLNG